MTHHHGCSVIKSKMVHEPPCLRAQGGVFLVNLLNEYGPGKSILFVVFVEAAGVCWFYGVDRFSRDIEKMLGFRPGLFWRLCWTFISPVFLLVRDLVSF